MKNKIIKKIISLSILSISLLSASQVKANAEWRQDTNGWWYSEGNSWVTGEKIIDGKEYYFNKDGYMVTGWYDYGYDNWYYYYPSGEKAKNTTIDGRKLGMFGEWNPTQEKLTIEYDSSTMKATSWCTGVQDPMNNKDSVFVFSYKDYGYNNKDEAMKELLNIKQVEFNKDGTLKFGIYK